MSRVVIWKRDIDSEIKKLYKSAVLPDIAGYRVQLELSDDILDVLEKEKENRIPALMVEDAQDACAETCQRIAKLLKALDNGCNKMPPATVDKAVKDIKVVIDGEISKLGLDLKTVPKKRWDKWIATKKQYKDYKWDCAGKVALGTLGAVGSGLAIAAAVPTGGATLALGIVGGVKSGVELAKLSVKLWVEAETVQKKVFFSINALTKIYRDAKKSKQGGAAEAGFAVLNAILPLEMGPTIKVLSGDIDLWSNKLAGIEVSAAKLTKMALKSLTDADELEKKLKASKSKNAGKILDKLKKLRIEVNKGLDGATSESARVRQGRLFHALVEKKILPELKAAQPKWVEVFDKLFPAAVSLGLAGAGAGLGFQDAKTALDFTQSSLDLANEILAQIKDAVED